jgi:AmmeMemoRadiSam system protein B
VAPHAGWFYSGRIAGASVAALDAEAETVAVIGGHLGSGMSPLFFEEDGVATPLGPLEIDREFRDVLQKELAGYVFPQHTDADRYQDNTVEILLPIVAYFFPKARILPFRLPAEAASFEAGKAINRIAEWLERKIVVLGSTDLTHYGESYGFTPQGSGKRALEWMRNVNDRAFIQAVLEGVPETILQRAEQDRSACSAGAVLGALGFAQARGADKGELLVYGVSADVYSGKGVPEDFVGYGAIAWYKG